MAALVVVAQVEEEEAALVATGVATPIKVVVVVQSTFG
jgi:hypothetical protein